MRTILPQMKTSDGRLDHVTIYAPCGFDPDDVKCSGPAYSHLPERQSA